MLFWSPEDILHASSNEICNLFSIINSLISLNPNFPVNLSHYSCFENMGRFATLKKESGPKYGVQKAGCKKQGHCYSKRGEARLPLLFVVFS